MRHCSAIIMAEATRVSQEEAGADDMKPQCCNSLVSSKKFNRLSLSQRYRERNGSHQPGTRRREHVLNTAVISETKSHRYYESYTPVPSARTRRGRGINCGMLADWPRVDRDSTVYIYTLRITRRRDRNARNCNKQKEKRAVFQSSMDTSMY